ncbi:hypothetical protein N9W34_00420 [Rickettsiales bacterium]|nr:hypothetical protein [Rickettsiales bacterium]
MCFSPEVSFVAGVVIASIGIATLRKVAYREEILFAAIPLLFASQQFIEGSLWLVLQKGGMPMPQYWLTQIFSAYAGIIWPILVPLSIFMIEGNEDRKKVLGLLFIMGFGIAIYMAYGMMVGEISSQVVGHCIQYNYPLSQGHYVKWIYLAIVGLPFFLSRHPILHKIGIINIIMFFIAYYAYTETYVSVWCFFAAVISGLIYFYFRAILKGKSSTASYAARKHVFVKSHPQVKITIMRRLLCYQLQ